MLRLAAIYRALAQVRNPSVDRALADAIPTARGKAFVGLAQAVIDRRSPDGCLALVTHLHRLPEASYNLVVQRAGDFSRPIREAMASANPQTVANAVELIRRCGSAKLAYLMVDQLRHGSPSQKEVAAHCLLHLASQPLSGPDAQYLLATVHEALAAFAQHRQPAVLLAAAHLVPRGLREAPRLLSDAHHTAYTPWQQLLRNASDPCVRRSLLLMFSHPSLIEAAGEGLRHAATGDGMRDLLASSHFLALPAAARGLSTASPLTTPAAPATDSAGLPALLAAWPADRTARVTALTALHAHSDPLTRLLALRMLLRKFAAGRDAALTEAFLAFTRDADPAIARIAATHALHASRGDLAPLLGEFAASPHPAVRALSAARFGPHGFARLWDSWPRLHREQRLTAGRALIKLDPHFHRFLGARLASADRNSRLRALSIITALGQGDFFEPSLAALATCPDERVAATAARALAGAAGDHARVALEDALDHHDPRVRANALESLALRGDNDHGARFAAMAEDDHARPRASAIAALLVRDTHHALASLRKMLEDRRPPHRVSAVWLTEAAGVLDVAPHVGELAVSDPDRDVQRHARVALKKLLARMSPPHLGTAHTLDDANPTYLALEGVSP